MSNVNRLLIDPQMVPIWSAPGASSQASSSAAGSSQPAPGPIEQVAPEQFAQMQELLASIAQGGQQQQPGTFPKPHLILILALAPLTPTPSDISLSDILTPASLTPLFAHPQLVHALFPHLPPDLPSPPTEETLLQIVASPQFRAAVRNFDQALRTGLLGGLVRGLGLPEEAGTGVEAFLRAVQEQAEGDDGDRMDTD